MSRARKDSRTNVRKLPATLPTAWSEDEERGVTRRAATHARRGKRSRGNRPRSQRADGPPGLDDGKALFREKKYPEGAEKYKVAYKRWPDSPLEEEALFMPAECYFFVDRYPQAEDTYAC